MDHEIAQLSVAAYATATVRLPDWRVGAAATHAGERPADGGELESAEDAAESDVGVPRSG